MKIRIRILPILLSFMVFTTYFFQFSYVVYASSSGIHPDPNKPLGNILVEGAKNAVFYMISQLGALADGSFYNFLENQAVWEDYWNGDNVSVSDDGTITFSEDLVKYIKQALKEYAEETNGYIICPTIHFSTLSSSTFGSSYQYQTAKSLVNEDGICAVMLSNGGLLIKDIPGYLDGSAGFYINYSYGSYYQLYMMDLKSWSLLNNGENSLSMNSKFGKVIHDWEEAASSDAPSDGFYYYGPSETFYSHFICPASKDFVFSSKLRDQLVSKDGRNVLVFKSKAALQNYSVEHRSVYFGSKFYDDSGAVTATFDDLQDWLDGKYDDFWDKIKDLIPEGSNLSEEDLEKLVDKLLDQLKEVGDKVEEGNKETNSLLEKILDALNSLDDAMVSALSGISFDTSGIEEYLAAILEDLDFIAYKLEDMTMDEAEEKTDSLIASLVSAFSEIADVARLKFPTSIPWDIYNILNLFSGGGASPSAYESVSAVYSSDYGIMLLANDGDPPDELFTDAVSYDVLTVPSPQFELPLIIDSWGINESIAIDLSDFEVVSQMSRALFSCVFIAGLANLTFKVVDFGRELFS